MKVALSVLLATALAFVFAGGVQAEEKKEVTLNGTILCAKCALKAEGVTKCTTAIRVKEGDKEVVYFFDDKGAKETYHEEVCGGATKEGSVTGVVSKKDGKLMIKPSKVEYAKK
jgi:hypothetical protein